MSKYDPKLIKSINQSQLILAATAVGIKNASKIAKENLVGPFIKAVEALSEEEQKNLDDQVIETYNGIVQKLNKQKEEAEGAGESQKTKGVDKPSKEKKPPKEKKEKVPKYTRTHSVADAFKKAKKGTLEQIGKAANTLYVQKGGNDSLKDSIWIARTMMEGMVQMGLATRDDKGVVSLNS